MDFYEFTRDDVVCTLEFMHQTRYSSRQDWLENNYLKNIIKIHRNDSHFENCSRASQNEIIYYNKLLSVHAIIVCAVHSQLLATIRNSLNGWSHWSACHALQRCISSPAIPVPVIKFEKKKTHFLLFYKCFSVFFIKKEAKKMTAAKLQVVSISLPSFVETFFVRCDSAQIFLNS